MVVIRGKPVMRGAVIVAAASVLVLVMRTLPVRKSSETHEQSPILRCEERRARKLSSQAAQRFRHSGGGSNVKEVEGRRTMCPPLLSFSCLLVLLICNPDLWRPALPSASSPRLILSSSLIGANDAMKLDVDLESRNGMGGKGWGPPLSMSVRLSVDVMPDSGKVLVSLDRNGWESFMHAERCKRMNEKTRRQQ